jgi:hypothetical protein
MAVRTARRPLGITLLAALVLLVGIAHIVIALEFLGIIDWGDAEFPGGDWLGAIVFLAEAALALWVGYGLWKLNSGAWIFVNLLAVFGVVSAFMTLIGDTSTAPVLPALLISLAILVYCNTRPVRAAFRV